MAKGQVYYINFYPRSPCGERRSNQSIISQANDFYPRSPCGERQSQPPCGHPTTNFYPRSPCGERLDTANSFGGNDIFLSTLSLRRATQAKALKVATLRISIHALLAESDQSASYNAALEDAISIHALLAESDSKDSMISVDKIPFLSTLSLRRATAVVLRIAKQARDFYPRSPCGERRPAGVLYCHLIPNFYPRSPCGERPETAWQCVETPAFLSTLSLRRATVFNCFSNPGSTISIHALLAESDS